MAGFLGLERLASGPWQAFDRAILRLLMHHGFQDCYLVDGPGDRGADILAVHGSRAWVIQAKFRSNQTAAPDSALSEILDGLQTYDGSIGVIAANRYFNDSLYRDAQQRGRDTGWEIRLWPGRVLLEYFEKLPDFPHGYEECRQYQMQAVEAVEMSRSRGGGRGLVAMATGLGKTRVAAELVAREIGRERGSEVLVLAHTVPLVHQFEESLWRGLPKQIVTHIWDGRERPAFREGVVCATFQSLLSETARRDVAGRFPLVIVDEAHHAAAPGYRSLLEELHPDYLLGLTATPWRGDRQLLSEVFGRTVFSMSIVEGMQLGYLCGVDYRMLVDDVDWDQVSALSRKGLTVRDLNRYLYVPGRDAALVDTVVSHLHELANARGIVFCRSAEHATLMANLLRAAGISCSEIYAAQGRQEVFRLLRGFRQGQFSVLVGVDLLNEGLDIPDVNLIVFARVTHNRRIFVQQLGRGLRLSRGKESVRVLDFVADIRRIAAALDINREAEDVAAERGKEIVRFPSGQIVQFSNDRPLEFFGEYLADVAELETIDDSAVLRFPPDP